MRGSDADFSVNLVLLCIFNAPISCLLHCHLYSYEVNKTGRALHMKSPKIFTYVNEAWSIEHWHKNVSNMNSFWCISDNRAGRCAEVGEHFSVPTGQFCAEEGVRHLTGVGSPSHRIWMCSWHTWEEWGLRVQIWVGCSVGPGLLCRRALPSSYSWTNTIIFSIVPVTL